jgi:hypothetical protein
MDFTAGSSTETQAAFCPRPEVNTSIMRGRAWLPRLQLRIDPDRKMPVKRALLVALVALNSLACVPALAQAPQGSVFQESCPTCGVVRSVKRIEKETPARTEHESPAGIVASVPLGGGPVSAGSATDVRRELQPPAVSYEIVVRLDDGRFQLVRQDDTHGLREGDKVRIDAGKVVLRSR